MVLFLEPGGDATLSTVLWTTKMTGGISVGSVSAGGVATDFVHGAHLRSIKYRPATSDVSSSPANIPGAGGRFSAYFYINALPAATRTLIREADNGANPIWFLRITSGGVLQFTDGTFGTPTVFGTGSTLSTGTWYRISVAWTISSTTVNQFRVYINGVLDITLSNITLSTDGTGGSDKISCGKIDTDANFDLRSSDHYIDDSTSLVDTGDIWVTAKRPVSNGTNNDFPTQIGAGGSGYGSGHSPQVNERALSNSNGWSVLGAGSAITEEYNIEGKSVGDIDITIATIIDYMAWVDASSALSETGKIRISNVDTNIPLTSTESVFSKVAGSSIYPTGAGHDVGVLTDTTITTVSLFECGIVVAYIPSPLLPQQIVTRRSF